jgi:hypothetical protein
VDNSSLVGEGFMLRRILELILAVCFFVSFSNVVLSEQSDSSTHRSDHNEDALVETLPMVHVHGLRLNKDQQIGPVPQKTPWPTIPIELEGKELDDWLKARFLISKEGKVTVVVLQPAAHHELTQVSLEALNQWTFLPQMEGDNPVDGEVSIRIHFRTQ